MNLRELRYLVALADHRHFGRAADACFVSQPTLSTQLKKLEDYLGVTLFERTTKSVHITSVGQEIVAKARQTLAEADSILDVAKRSLGPLDTTLNLGIIPTLCPYMIPWLVPPLKAAYPDLRLTLQEDFTHNLIEKLVNHQIDAAILSLPVNRDGLKQLALFDEPFWFICPKDHELSELDVIGNEALESADILLITEGHCLRDQMLSLCPADGMQGEGDDFRATSLESIRKMVTAGLGCTLMPAMAVDRTSSLVEVRPLKSQASRSVGLIWRHGYDKERDLRLLAQLVWQHLPDCVNSVQPRQPSDDR